MVIAFVLSEKSDVFLLITDHQPSEASNPNCQANKFIPRENDKNYPALVS